LSWRNHRPHKLVRFNQKSTKSSAWFYPRETQKEFLVAHVMCQVALPQLVMMIAGLTFDLILS
jgi:hypothetical protein